MAALLEIARQLRGVRPRRTVRFVAFTNEEPPFFRSDQLGSYRYAKLCHERNEKIAAMICLETIGYYTDEPETQRYPLRLFNLLFPTTANFVAFVSNVQSSRLLFQSVHSFRRATAFPARALALPRFLRGVDFSDQESFWRFGFPAIMITDTANYRYPHYHELTDTPDKLNYDALARVTLGITAMVRDLCGTS